MFSYRVRPRDSLRNCNNTAYLWIDRRRPIEFDTPTEQLAVLRDDYKFVVYQNAVYRVCEIELDDDDMPFIKFWTVDPFIGYEEYEQIPVSVHPCG